MTENTSVKLQKRDAKADPSPLPDPSHFYGAPGRYGTPLTVTRESFHYFPVIQYIKPRYEITPVYHPKIGRGPSALGYADVYGNEEDHDYIPHKTRYDHPIYTFGYGVRNAYKKRGHHIPVHGSLYGPYIGSGIHHSHLSNNIGTGLYASGIGPKLYDSIKPASISYNSLYGEPHGYYSTQYQIL